MNYKGKDAFQRISPAGEEGGRMKDGGRMKAGAVSRCGSRAVLRALQQRRWVPD